MIRYIDEPGMITPFGEQINADIAVTAFSTYIFAELLKGSGASPCGVLKGGVDIPLYTCTLDGKTALIYQTPIGAPAAVAAMEEITACGIKKFVAFGICGALVGVPVHTFIVPDKAFRDEGTSYHYLPASEYIDLPNSGTVESSLKRSGINIMKGGVWTTDGFYRETPTRTQEMRDNGCIAVDMECSALQAAADFRGSEFYTFFITADSLAEEEWEPNDILEQKASDSTVVAVAAALELARTLA